MNKLNKTEFLSLYSSNADNVRVITDDQDCNGELDKFDPRGDEAKILAALPESIVAKVFSYSEEASLREPIYSYLTPYSLRPNEKKEELNKLAEKEDGGDKYFIVYIENLFSWYDDFIKSMYPYKVSVQKIRRSLGAKVCKMLDILHKEVVEPWNYVHNDYYWGYVGYSTRQGYNDVLASCVKKYRECLKRVLRKSSLLDYKQYSFDDAVVVWLSEYEKAQADNKRIIKEQKKAQEKAQKIFDKEQRKIGQLYDGASSWYDAKDVINNSFRTGEHIGKVFGRFWYENNVTCTEERDPNGYSRSCKYSLVTRSFTLQIQKGWRMRKVGGILTFYRGKFNRDGMKVEWVEQGKAIADFTKHTGFLVRGEHIEAESLKAAKRINEEHRAMKLARLLSSRKRAERRAEEKENGDLKITFSDSLKAGNCRPGTQEFKNKYEAAIGHSAKSISIKDLRKYAKEFGVEYYAEQAIEYALNH